LKTHHCPCLPNSWCPNESQSSAKSSLKLNLVSLNYKNMEKNENLINWLTTFCLLKKF
jgi:hypothetical protein